MIQTFVLVRKISTDCGTGTGDFYFGPVVDGKFVPMLPDQAFKTGNVRARCTTVATVPSFVLLYLLTSLSSTACHSSQTEMLMK
jgi:hypothetical protein